MLTVNQMREYTIESPIKTAASMGKTDTFTIIDDDIDVEEMKKYLNASDFLYTSILMRTATGKYVTIFHICWK